MRFAQRTYTILSRLPSQPIFGELSRFLAPKASPPSSATTDRPPTPSTSSSPACTKCHFRPRGISSQSACSAPRVSQPSPATDLDRTGSNRLTSSDTICILLIQAYGFTAIEPLTPGIGLGRLVSPAPRCFELFPPSPRINNDVGDFRRLGPRMDASDSAQVTRSFVAAIPGSNPAADRFTAFPSAPAFPSPCRRIASQPSLTITRVPHERVTNAVLLVCSQHQPFVHKLPPLCVAMLCCYRLRNNHQVLVFLLVVSELVRRVRGLADLSWSRLVVVLSFWGALTLSRYISQ